MRVPSDHPVKKGGWIHRLDESTTPARPRPKVYGPPVEPVKIDAKAIMAFYREQASIERLTWHAADLGLTVESLARLGIGWAPVHRAWAFPMHDESCRVIGIRLRAETGEKWAVSGSRSGLFIPDGQVGEQCNQIVVCEGPTDTAAMLDLGFYAIGRPACLGCEEMTLKLLWGRQVVILADNDDAKKRPDGSLWFPGREGAEKLADILAPKTKWTKIIYPRFKDARAWLQAGATAAAVKARVNSTFPWRPENGR